MRERCDTVHKTIYIAVKPECSGLELIEAIKREHGEFFFDGISYEQIERLLYTGDVGVDGKIHLTFGINTITADTGVYTKQCHEQRLIYDLFKDAASLLKSKAADYSIDTDSHSNFTHALYIANMLPPAYTAYGVLIGVKLARLGVLLADHKVPHHESIRDSILDLMNYVALMGEKYLLAMSPVREIEQENRGK